MLLENYWKTNWIILEILKERGVGSINWEEVVQKHQETKCRLEIMSNDELSDQILNHKEVGMALEILEERGVDNTKLDNWVTRGVELSLRSAALPGLKRRFYKIIVAFIILGLFALYLVALYVVKPTGLPDGNIGECIENPDIKDEVTCMEAGNCFWVPPMGDGLEFCCCISGGSIL